MVNTTITPTVSALTLNGLAPIKDGPGYQLVPGSAALSLAPNTPFVFVPSGALTLTANTPAVGLTRILTPAAASLILSGVPPGRALAFTVITPPAAVLSATQFAPIPSFVFNSPRISPPAASLTLASSLPRVLLVTVPYTGSAFDIAARVKILIPKRWFAWAAPQRDAVIGGLADLASWSYAWWVYAKKQSRLATATGPWLDVFCYDFLQRYLLRNGLTDDAFRTLIQVTILQERVTRAGMQSSLTRLLNGVPPKIIEPWNTGDCGSYGGNNIAYGRAGAWGSINLPGQCFIKISRQGLGPSGIGDLVGYGGTIGGYGSGRIAYVGSTLAEHGITNPVIYDMINKTKPTGVIVWTQIN